MKNRIIQSGRSMVEMMGYMAVVLSVTAGIGTLISNTYDEYKYSKASLQISDLAAAIVRSSAVDADYTDVVANVSAVNDKGRKIIPKSFHVVGTRIYHAFGGTVTVATVDDDPTKFTIRFNNLKRKQCIELAMKEWQNNKSVDLFEIAVNSNYWYWAAYSDVGDTDNTLPVKRSIVAGSDAHTAQCRDENNVIMWVFN